MRIRHTSFRLYRGHSHALPRGKERHYIERYIILKIVLQTTYPLLGFVIVSGCSDILEPWRWLTTDTNGIHHFLFFFFFLFSVFHYIVRHCGDTKIFVDSSCENDGHKPTKHQTRWFFVALSFATLATFFISWQLEFNCRLSCCARERKSMKSSCNRTRRYVHTYIRFFQCEMYTEGNTS